jgi:hypothetical protein
VAISVYDSRIAALDTRGVVVITRPGGKQIGQIRVGPAKAIALRKNVLVALGRDGSLSVYSLASGHRLHSWSVGKTASSLDVEYGIALVTAGRDVHAVNLRTGRTARVYRAPAPVSAEIESPGAVVHFNAAGHGHLEFIPMSKLEAGTR